MLITEPQPERKSKRWRIAKKLLQVGGLSVGAALVDVGLLDAVLYQNVLQLAKALGVL